MRLNLLFFSILILISCTVPIEEPFHVSSASKTSSSSISSSSSSSIQRLEILGSTIDEKVEFIITNMTLSEKIGQMTMGERLNPAILEDIRDWNLGAVLNGGGSVPGGNTPSEWADMIDGMQTYATQGRFAIPIIYGTDAVHGHNNLYGAVIFPHNIGLGCMGDSNLVFQASEVTAKEVYATGVHWTFSPCIAVPRNERWGRTYEGFGETPGYAISNVGAAILGYQGPSIGTTNRVLACAKHYFGDGGTIDGVDQGDTPSGGDLETIHLAPYQTAVDLGVGSVMISYSSISGNKMHKYGWYINTVLKGAANFGFEGIVISDWYGVDYLTADKVLNEDKVVDAINAGIDMFMQPYNYKTFINYAINAVNGGRIAITRINDAVRRILKIKYRMGIIDHPMSDRNLAGQIGSTAHRNIARACVRKSLVLLTNYNNILPISQSASIHIAGKNADNLGNQCGGWTIKWQGESGNTLTDGTTIKQGFDSLTTGNVIYSIDGSSASATNDVGIVVIGEMPYAEWFGDSSNLDISADDFTAVTNVASKGIPVVVIIVSGRPMIIDSIMPYASAIVAAWLPGTEGGGVAEVIFNNTYNFTGKLSHSWPRAYGDIPINWGDGGYDPLFELGWGL